MNREKLLLLGVLGIFALWFFVMRTPAEAVEKAAAGTLKMDVLPVRAATRTPVRLSPESRVFTLRSNAQPHPRPVLAPPIEVELENIWPPTSRSLRLDRLGALRRAATAAAEDDAATITLPALETVAAAGNGGPTFDRLDMWGNRSHKGRVTGLKVGNKLLRPQRTLPPPGKLDDYHRYLVMLETDPEAVRNAGVRQVEVQFRFNDKFAGTVMQNFPSEVSNFRIAVEGRQKSWFEGAKEYVRLPAVSFERRKDVGARLLQRGVNKNDDTLKKWALVCLTEARAQVPAGSQNALKEIQLLMMESANQLNQQEHVLDLGFQHLRQFGRENDVLEYVGNVLASRSFGLDAQALDCYRLAAGSSSAQRARAALLIRMGRFDEAEALLNEGAAGQGDDVNLLRARVALAQGNFADAQRRASGLTSGRNGAEAHQILGGVAYAQGDAAGAEAAFMRAVEASPRRSSAYSDLGLALAVQGKAADAQLCFDRALKLDFENAVIPKIGAAFLALTAGTTRANDALALTRAVHTKTAAKRAADEQIAELRSAAKASIAAANEILADLEKNNPRDLLVRYYRGFGYEMAGDLAKAAAVYRAVLDDDHRYRIAIARLGRVQSQRVDEDEKLATPAIAHLRKAVDLNPKDPIISYVLGRFLLVRDERARLADRLLQQTETLPAPGNHPHLKLWAGAGRAALLYRDKNTEVLRVKSGFASVIDDVRDQVTRSGASDQQRALEAHPVYRYVQTCRSTVEETEQMTDETWEFRTRPRDWNLKAKAPMRIALARGKGLHFHGTVNFQGKLRDFNNILEFCALEYKNSKLNGRVFREVTIEGEFPAGSAVDIGVGVVGQSRRRGSGPAGVQLRRRGRSGNAELRIEGSRNAPFKAVKGKNFVELTEVKWPTGKFNVRIKLEKPEKGLFSLWLNGTNVLEAQFDRALENTSILGRSGGRPVSIYVWVEGNDGTSFENIYIKKVTLTSTGR